METIKNYLDNMFAALLQTPQLMKLKEDMLAAMEDKYNEQKEMGKSENEAIGQVISEFGNIEEILREMDIQQGKPDGFAADQATEAADELPVVTREEAEEFMSVRERSGLLIGIGVFLCITSPILFTLSDGLSFDPLLAVAALFIHIAIAVSLFIYSGFIMEKFKYMEGFFHLPSEVREFVKQEKEAFAGIKMISIIGGVAVLILSPMAFMLLNKGNEISPTSIELISLPVFFLMIAAGVFCFIYSGMKDSGYNMLLKLGDYTDEYKKSQKEMEPLAGIYWSIMVCIYLGWSFTTGDWSYTWIIWPIAGVFYSVVHLVFQYLFSKGK